MVSILHTNDMHGRMSPTILEALRGFRAECDLYFDSGDVIKTGNLGIPMKPEAMWDVLAELRCDAGVLGNRETHPLAAAFMAKLAGARHPLLCANLVGKDGVRPFPGSLVLVSGGLRIGVVGVMVPMVTAKMKTQFASAYLWEPPITRAQEVAEGLRSSVDALFALTHIGSRSDNELAKTGAFDVIFGSHSHTVLAEPELVGKDMGSPRWISQPICRCISVGRPTQR